MKILFLAIALLVGTYASNAQATSIQIRNNSQCTVYFTLGLTRNPNPCTSPITNSSVISLAPGALVNYTGTTWPGYTTGSPYTNFIMGRFYDTNPTAMCGFPFVIVGEPCGGFATALGMRWYNTNCSVCANGSVMWLPPGIPTGMIDVTIN